jgi:cell division inhibitor SulA
MKNIISLLQNKRLVWKASHQPSCSFQYTQTGFGEVDEALDGGWPQAGVVSLKSILGVGELRLFLPALKQRCQQSNRLLVIISPPCSINAEMLCEHGFDLQNIILLQPESRDSQLWSAEQCLKSGCCEAVLIWQANLQVHQVKRLQLAAQQGDALNVVFSHKRVYQSLPFSLSIEVFPTAQGIEVKVNKRRGGWPLAPFKVSMHKRWPQLTKPKNPDNLLHFPQHKASL